MTEASLYDQILDFSNRANPWPLYEKLRSQPVWQESDGTFVVSTYREIYALMHDPRLSSDMTNLLPQFADRVPPAEGPHSFITTDPPRSASSSGVCTRLSAPEATSTYQSWPWLAPRVNITARPFGAQLGPSA